jgi:hypothetical protein
MRADTTIGDLANKVLYFEKLAAGYNPTPSYTQWELYYIYRYGKAPVVKKKLCRVKRKLHHIYTLR